MIAEATDDRTLIGRIRLGDEQAFAMLVTRHHAALLRLAMVFCSSRSVAEEVVQETWLAVLQGLDRFEARSSLKTWIFRILSNRAKTRAVREGRQIPFSAIGPDDEDGADADRFDHTGHWTQPPTSWETSSPEALAARAETMAWLEQAIAKLPPKQRAVVTLRDVEGLDSDEVCNVLELADTHQRVLLHRGRQALRRALDEHLARKP